MEEAVLTNAPMLMLFIPSQTTVQAHSLLFLPRNHLSLRFFPLGQGQGHKEFKGTEQIY